MGVESITKEELRRHVVELADDRYRGRVTGKPGLELAADYLSRELTSYGLAPLAGQSSFRVSYTLYEAGYDADRTVLQLTLPDQTTLDGALGSSFRPFPFAAESRVESAELVFAGYGITAPEYEYDDYADLDVTGKVVLVLRREPNADDPESPFDGTETTDHGLFTRKAMNAKRHGAVGMILVTDPKHPDATDNLRAETVLRYEKGMSAQRGGPGLPAVHISRDLAAQLLAQTDSDLEALQTALDSGTAPAALDLTLGTVRLGVETYDSRPVSVPNIIAVIPGTEQPDEYVVFGAHYDHIGGYDGANGEDTIYNGADDNASGTAGLLELAQAWSQSPPPKRSLVFAFFSGEEMGLYGSRAMVRDETVPPSQVRLMINMDMIGRMDVDNPLQLIGDGYASGLSELATATAAGLDLDLKLGGTSYSGNSDHDPFFQEFIPAVHLFTGLHDDYHQVTDHSDKVTFTPMEGIVRLAYLLSEPVARGDLTPLFIHRIGWLGATLQVVDGAVTITAVEDDSRAREAGLAAGDVILVGAGALEPTEAVEDRMLMELESVDAIGPAFGDLEPGAQLALPVQTGDDAPRWVALERAKTGYLGIYPGQASEDFQKANGLGDSEGVVVRQVVPDGPAMASGLEQEDVIIRIAGRPVGAASLGRVLQRIGAGEKVPIVVIRGEERLDLELVLGERPRR